MSMNRRHLVTALLTLTASNAVTPRAHGQTSATPYDINDDSFDTKVHLASARQPVIVYFKADWCPPCRSLRASGVIDQIRGDLANTAQLLEYEVPSWKSTNIKRFKEFGRDDEGKMALPTFAIFVAGKCVGHVSVTDRAAQEEKIVGDDLDLQPNSTVVVRKALTQLFMKHITSASVPKPTGQQPRP